MNVVIVYSGIGAVWGMYFRYHRRLSPAVRYQETPKDSWKIWDVRGKGKGKVDEKEADRVVQGLKD